MPSDCMGACACDCRSINPLLKDVEDKLDKLEKENYKLREENQQLRAKIKALGNTRDEMIDRLARKLKDMEK